MQRRTLTIRRFGDLSFGLGYVEDGVWIDHAVAAARGEDLLTGASAAERAALDAIHTWHACCDAGTVTEAEERAAVAFAGSGTS
jgi:hypothetical protein